MKYDLILGVLESTASTCDSFSLMIISMFLRCESRSGSVAVETFESTVIPAGLPNWKSELL